MKEAIVTPILKNWCVEKLELFGMCGMRVHGNVYGHPELKDGEWDNSEEVLSMDINPDTEEVLFRTKRWTYRSYMKDCNFRLQRKMGIISDLEDWAEKYPPAPLPDPKPGELQIVLSAEENGFLEQARLNENGSIYYGVADSLDRGAGRRWRIYFPEYTIFGEKQPAPYLEYYIFVGDMHIRKVEAGDFNISFFNHGDITLNVYDDEGVEHSVQIQY